ncbi:uncharacterized protein IWZ02DRAFT_111054 [Phyllosticta citriasiana]|uniref:uncharacterized protein n=1 Tax=Phyllosticta citriasiana TaxID=595635 RepID=UPI0030FDABE5
MDGQRSTHSLSLSLSLTRFPSPSQLSSAQLMHAYTLDFASASYRYSDIPIFRHCGSRRMVRVCVCCCGSFDTMRLYFFNFFFFKFFLTFRVLCDDSMADIRTDGQTDGQTGGRMTGCVVDSVRLFCASWMHIFLVFPRSSSLPFYTLSSVCISFVPSLSYHDDGRRRFSIVRVSVCERARRHASGKKEKKERRFCTMRASSKRRHHR